MEGGREELAADLSMHASTMRRRAVQGSPVARLRRRTGRRTGGGAAIAAAPQWAPQLRRRRNGLRRRCGARLRRQNGAAMAAAHRGSIDMGFGMGLASIDEVK